MEAVLIQDSGRTLTGSAVPDYFVNTELSIFPLASFTITMTPSACRTAIQRL